MLTKCFEVHRIFRDMDQDLGRLLGLVTDLKTIKFLRLLGILLFLQLIILIIWTAVDPWKATQRLNDPINLIYTWECTTNR